jgi:glycosyltransferase involved in cell wall biosynthesis
MHLAIDTVGARYGGGAAVALLAVEAALTHPGVSALTIFSSLERLRRFSWPKDPRVQVIEPAAPDLSSARRFLWPLLGLAQQSQRLGVQRLLCLSNAGFGPTGVPTTVFVQQNLPFCKEALALSPLSTRLRVNTAQLLTRASALRASRVIVQTRTTRRWLARDFELPESSVHIVPHDPGPPLERPNAPRDRFRLLYVGSDAAHKNLNCALAAVGKLRERHPALHLACTLPSDHPATKQPGIIGLGYLDRDQLQAEYFHAGALIMPSLVETIGLPLLEAQRCGLPIVVADRPYAHDVCEGSGLLFDPIQPDSLVRAIERHWADTEGCEQRVQRGLQSVAALHAQRGYTQLIELALNAPL